MNPFSYDASLNYFRRFGAELEINAFDMRNRPVDYDHGSMPDGILYVGDLVQQNTGDRVLVQKWGLNHFNTAWIVKPDASCGIEICSPVLKGWVGIMNLCNIVKAFGEDSKIVVDTRCSFHVHVDVSDLSKMDLVSVLSWWLKFEPVFMDSVPFHRKLNQYCQVFGIKPIIKHDAFYEADYLIRLFGEHKYSTLNTYHYVSKNRKTIEFRIMDHMCCKDPWMAKNWIRLLIHFVECCVKKGLPVSYKENDPWTGYCWLDPIDLFSFLNFFDSQISPGMEQVRDWFLSRLKKNVKNSERYGAFSSRARSFSIKQIKELDRIFPAKIYYGDHEIFSDKFRI